MIKQSFSTSPLNYGKTSVDKHIKQRTQPRLLLHNEKEEERKERRRKEGTKKERRRKDCPPSVPVLVTSTFRTLYRQTSRPTQPPVQSVVFLLQVKRPDRDADHQYIFSTELRMVSSYASPHPLCACIGMSCGRYL
jgi:hypothetical protein